MICPSDIAQKKVLLLGDLMLDHYTFGTVERISPEAPVPILHVKREEFKPGGAGNALLNLKALGLHVFAMGMVGDDETGKQIIRSLQSQSIDTSGIVVDPYYQTTRKNRLIASQQQIVRVDYETITPLSYEVEAQLWQKIPIMLQQVDTVAISDYGKGFLSHSFLRKFLLLCKEHELPVIVDPKGKDFFKYQGVTILKPNYAEALHASGLSSSANLDEIAKAVLNLSQAQHLLITLSEKGASLFTKNSRIDFPASVRAVKDVTGAGDTVLAVMTLAIAANLSLETGVELANLAAGLAVEHVGCAVIDLETLLDAHSKIKNRILV